MHPGEIGRGEDLALGALRPVALVLSVRPGRLPGSRRWLAAVPRRAGAARRRSARGAAPRRRAVLAAARLAQRPRRVAVRSRLRRFARAQGRQGRDERKQGEAVDVASRWRSAARDGKVLLAQRLPGTPYAGYWEFPGGKLEPGESRAQALLRELDEELGIDVTRATPWLTRATPIRTRTSSCIFSGSIAWRGEPHGREDQAIAWQRPAHSTSRRCCRPTRRCCARCVLPPVYGDFDGGGARAMTHSSQRARSRARAADCG